MALLAFWPAPSDEDTAQIKVERAPASTGPWAEVIVIAARDYYSNWVTHYQDEGGTTGDYYRAHYLHTDGSVVGTSTPLAGDTVYAVTPQDVLDSIQGLPMNAVNGRLVQNRIRWAIAWVEKQIRMKLSTQTATKEIYDRSKFSYLVGNRIGARLQLRHFPVQTVDNIYYRLRTGSNPTDEELTGLDIVIEAKDEVSGYNRGTITVYPTYSSFSGIFAGYLGRLLDPYDVSVKITYTYGFTANNWPEGLEEAVTLIAAGDVMEIAGEAETAGLSSRSIDGYSESYTASATTTIFSARRIWYGERIKEIIKQNRKPLWG